MCRCGDGSGWGGGGAGWGMGIFIMLAPASSKAPPCQAGGRLTVEAPGDTTLQRMALLHSGLSWLLDARSLRPLEGVRPLQGARRGA
jgi:hypothetical protein